MMMSFVIFNDKPPRQDRHRLAGAITVEGQPAKRLVVVIDRVTLLLKAAVFSHPATGAWEIRGIEEFPEGRLLVFSLDNSGKYNAEVADYVSQVATV